jgi:hypothetical protein
MHHISDESRTRDLMIALDTRSEQIWPHWYHLALEDLNVQTREAYKAKSKFEYEQYK